MIRVAAEPFDFTFAPATTALVVIDMQRDFVEPGGFGETLGNDVSRLTAIVPTVARLLALARAEGWTIVHTRESHDATLADCPPAKRRRGAPRLAIGDVGPMGRILVRGEPGNAILDAVAPAPGEIVIDKPGKGAFYATALGDILRIAGITHLIFAGVTTEVCVQTSMREANDRGWDCLLIEDATESYFPEFKAATLAMITAQGGIVGWVAPLSALEAAVATAETTEAETMDVNLPEVVAEVRAAFLAYEEAFVANDLAGLERLFWQDDRVVRYGIADMQHGAAELAAFRAAFPPVDLARDLDRTIVTTFGRDAATAATLFRRASAPGLVGRQMQTWARFADGWKVVAAHVSIVADDAGGV